MLKCIWDAIKEVGGEWLGHICFCAFVAAVVYGIFWLIVLLGWYSFLLIPIGAFIWNIFIEAKNRYRRLKNSLIDQLDSIYQDMHGEYCSLRRKTNWEERGWCMDPEVRKYFHEKFAEYEVLAGSFEKKYFGFAKDQYYKTIRLKYDCFKETIFRMFAEATG